MRVDCDVHCAPPSAAALAPYLPKHWEEYMRVLMHFRQPPGVNWTYPAWPEMFAGSNDVTLEDIQANVLDRADAAILHCFYGLESMNHPYLAPTLATAVNSWLQAEWLDKDERLLGSAVVAAQFPEAAVEEIDRVAETGRFVEVLLPAWSAAGYGTQRYWPVLEAAAKHGLVVGITYGGLTSTPPTPANWPGTFFEDYGVAGISFQSQLASIVYSGVLAEYPDLRFTISESGWTWLPGFLWRMDTEWKAYQREIPWVEEKPSAYLRRHFRFTTQPVDLPPSSEQLQQVLKHLGCDSLLLFGSDYPHTYRSTVDDLLRELGEEQAEQVLGASAREWYRVGASVEA